MSLTYAVALGYPYFIMGALLKQNLMLKYSCRVSHASFTVAFKAQFLTYTPNFDHAAHGIICAPNLKWQIEPNFN